MVLLIGMNALFEELDNNVVEYIGDSIMPKTEFNMTIHHDSLLLKNAQEIMEKIGGNVSGPHVLHKNGETLNNAQFESMKKEEDRNA